MSQKKLLMLDPDVENVVLSEEIKYIDIVVSPEDSYTLSGKIFFHDNETKAEAKILLVADFGDIDLSKEEYDDYGFSYSKKYGAYKYLTSNLTYHFSFLFSVPAGVTHMRLGFRSWMHQYHASIASKLRLDRVSPNVLCTEITQELSHKLLQLEDDLYKKVSNRIHLYNRANKMNTLVLTTRYPAHDDYYRNHFIHARVHEYIQNETPMDVFSLLGNKVLEHYRFEGVHVTKGSDEMLDDLLVFSGYKQILVHFLNTKMWQVLEKYIDDTKIYVWVHGSEIQPWYRRTFNYTTEDEIEKAKKLSDDRIAFWQSILRKPHPNLKLIFVSQYFANEVMEDYGITLPESSYEVIHNYINTVLFTYEKKSGEQRKKILSIRPYASKNYANDLSVQAVLYIKERYPEIFEDLSFTFIGDGVLFDETLVPIKGLDNVTIEKTFLKQKDIATLHREYGIFLSPTRMDSQGVSRDEAMSSGLVPITNNVAAISEFVDESCGVLAGENDYIGLAEGIVTLYKDSELFSTMSENAAKRVRLQCGYDKTILRELELMTPTNTALLV